MGSSWRIIKTERHLLKAPLIQPFRTALGDHHTLDNFLFSATLSDGTRGFGEAAVATHITGETHHLTWKNLGHAVQWMKNKDVRDYMKLSSELHELYGKNPAVIAAVETAVFDALTRSLNVALWKLFGGRCHKLKTDITIVIADLEETKESVQRFLKQGFRQFKIKIGRDFDIDVKRVEAVRAIAPKADIYLDANQGFSAKEILKFLRVLKRKKITPMLLEQPVPREDWEGLKEVSRLTDIPVCADESVRSVKEAARVIKEKAADVINIKLMKFGLVHSFEIARLAESSGIKLMIGGMMESSLAMTASAHLAAGLGYFSYIDLDTPFFIRNEVKRNPYLSESGAYDLSTVKKGIGIIPEVKKNL